MEIRTHIIVQITGEVLQINEEIERCDGQTIRHYKIDIKEHDEIDEFVKGLIIQ